MSESHSELQVVKIVEEEPFRVWVEIDLAGASHVMLQHERLSGPPFCYASFHYDYRYTCNQQVREAAIATAQSLGAVNPVDVRYRGLPTTRENV